MFFQRRDIIGTNGRLNGTDLSDYMIFFPPHHAGYISPAGRRWRRLRRPWFDMDWFEIVAPEASGEAVFSEFTLKWLSTGFRSTFRKPLNCPKNGERVR
jgi:hypothetical protein